MIPNIFISSTIEDLQYLRDAIRDTILELSYNPIMSEYGDVGYTSDMTAEESCYATIAECQLAILFIGKRYGSKSSNTLSITHNEYRIAKEKKIPIITLVDKEVQSFKKVYDENIEKVEERKYPGMDNPQGTFQLIKEVSESPLNNGILSFSTAGEAKNKLKKQLALIFGRLFISKFDPVKAQLKDVLAEIKTLRHDLVKDRIAESKNYMIAIRLLLDDEFDLLRDLSKDIHGDIEDAIPILIESKNFEDFLHKSGTTLTIKEWSGIMTAKELIVSGKLKNYHQFSPGFWLGEIDEWSYWTISRENNINMDETAKKCFEIHYEDFQEKLNKGIS